MPPVDASSTATVARSPARRWSDLGWALAAALLVIVLVGVWLQVRGTSSRTALSSAVLKGERPPAPALPQAQLPGDGAPGLPAWYAARDGRQVAPPEGGRVLVVNWWASWCGPCREEAPELRRIADDYADRGVTVVGLNAGMEDAAGDARRFVREYDLDFPIVRGTVDDKDAWGVAGYPETFIVGADGRVSAHVPGALDGEFLRELIDDELDRRPPDGGEA